MFDADYRSSDIYCKASALHFLRALSSIQISNVTVGWIPFHVEVVQHSNDKDGVNIPWGNAR
jgi:hypothetical protein